MIVRDEIAADVEAIRKLTAEAFAEIAYSDGCEPVIIDRLRAAGALTLSLVAEDDAAVIGHVAFSPVTISGETGDWYGLGPISVLPARQGQGIGSALVRAGLDRLKARKRREKWIAPPTIDPSGVERNPAEFLASRGPSPEEYVLRQERRRQLMDALGKLPERQRLVFVLSHFEGRSSREVSQATGLNESTVRVHLFRAIRRLRGLLSKGPHKTGTGSRRVSRAAN